MPDPAHIAPPVRVIGLVGQVCAGKSSVAAAFERRGAQVYRADKFVHQLYERDDVKQEVRALLGDGVFAPDGSIDRGRIAAVVFRDEDKLNRLTADILYPRTGQEISRWAEPYRRTSPPGAHTVLLLDAPTLFEAGRADICDAVLFVEAPRARREAWARENRGWADGELARREARMLDEKEKRGRCQAVITNSGTLDDLDRRVGELWKQWVVPGTR